MNKRQAIAAMQIQSCYYSECGQSPGFDAKQTSKHLTFADVRNMILDMMRLARSYAKLQEARCNTGLTPRQEKREAKIEAEILWRALELGGNAEFQGDPRGFTVRFGWNADLCHGLDLN